MKQYLEISTGKKYDEDQIIPLLQADCACCDSQWLEIDNGKVYPCAGLLTKLGCPDIEFEAFYNDTPTEKTPNTDGYYETDATGVTSYYIQLVGINGGTNPPVIISVIGYPDAGDFTVGDSGFEENMIVFQCSNGIVSRYDVVLELLFDNGTCARKMELEIKIETI